ncbi:MAG: hypothetical protein LBR23_08970 [Spirochaetaceae bacterium]|jgi:hypothetical protein|nr:hypothetical protein [Spirochaetaceae bacterium]
MKKTHLYFLICLGVFVSCLSAPEAGVYGGILVNNTGEALTEVYAAPVYTELWAQNLLEEPLPQGETRLFSVQDLLAVPYWDLYALGESGGEYRLEAVSFKYGESALFTADDGVEETGAEDW